MIRESLLRFGQGGLVLSKVPAQDRGEYLAFGWSWRLGLCSLRAGPGRVHLHPPTRRRSLHLIRKNKSSHSAVGLRSKRAGRGTSGVPKQPLRAQTVRTLRRPQRSLWSKRRGRSISGAVAHKAATSQRPATAFEAPIFDVSLAALAQTIRPGNKRAVCAASGAVFGVGGAVFGTCGRPGLKRMAWE